MPISPPSPDGSTGVTALTLGSALPAPCLTAPVGRSATSADLLSGPMLNPLVLSRQPCITPGAGHCFGNGLSGRGGGGGGVELGGDANLGCVVNGWDAESLNPAQTGTPSTTANSADNMNGAPTPPRLRTFMPARLRIVGRPPPRRHP